MPLKGDAALRYGSGPTTVNLNFPVFRADPGSYEWTSRSPSLDGSVIEVLSIGAPLNEISATLRFIDNPTEVLAALNAAKRGESIEYSPSLAGGTWIPFVWVDPPLRQVQLFLESSRRSYGEYQSSRMTWRRTDGGDWSALPGANL